MLPVRIGEVQVVSGVDDRLVIERHSKRLWSMTPATGTTPKGITSEQAASRWVRGMFGRVAGRYDLLNHLLSFNLDKRWRARTVERVARCLARPDARVLDLCCGTGDVLLALRSARRRRGILAAISAIPCWWKRGARSRRTKLRSPLFEADALALPLAIGFARSDHHRVRIPQSRQLSRKGWRNCCAC